MELLFKWQMKVVVDKTIFYGVIVFKRIKSPSVQYFCNCYKKIIK